MKVLVLALLLAAVVSVHAGDKEMYMLKKWAMHKACESCLGEENTKKFMIKIKKAKAKCAGQPVPPELSLPIFQNPHRIAGALVHGGLHAEKHGHDQKWMDRAMRRFFMKKMFKSFMKEQFEMDDDDDMEELDMDDGGPMRFFKASRRSNPFRGRYRRDIDSEVYDLSEKMTEKLEMEEEKMLAKIGNMTCMLQECGILDSQKQIVDVETIVNKMNEEFTIKDPWLAEQIETDIRKCHMFATSIPEEFFEDCMYPTYIGRVKMFKMCKKIAKLRTCMNYDIKNKVEAGFNVEVEELAEDVDMKTHQLLPLIYKMLHGDMDMH